MIDMTKTLNAELSQKNAKVVMDPVKGDLPLNFKSDAPKINALIQKIAKHLPEKFYPVKPLHLRVSRTSTSLLMISLYSPDVVLTKEESAQFEDALLIGETRLHVAGSVVAFLIARHSSWKLDIGAE